MEPEGVLGSTNNYSIHRRRSRRLKWHKFLLVVLLLQSIAVIMIFEKFQRSTNEKLQLNRAAQEVKTTKVWYYNEDEVPNMRHNSSRIVQTMDKDEEAVSWILRLSDMPKIAPIAAERMMLAVERQLQQKSGSNHPQLSNAIRANITGYLRNVTQDELNKVNPEWKLFIFDHSDRGVGSWGLWFMETELASMLGWKRIHYITRTTQEHHHMDSWVTQSKTNSEIANDFGTFAGIPINFTKHLGKACSSVQRTTYQARDDINDAIIDYMQQNFPSSIESTKSDTRVE